MIRNKYHQIPNPTFKTLGKETQSQKLIKKITKDTHSKPNEQLFPKQVVIQLPCLKTAATSIFYLFYILNYIPEQNRKHDGQLLFIDHIAEDHIHTDIIFNIQEPQQIYRLGTVRNRLLWY